MDSIARARTLLDLGRHEQAKEELAKAIADDPASTEAWCLLSQCEQKSGDLNGMLYAARQALASTPDSEWAHRLQALALHKLGRHDEAIHAAREAIRLAPHQWQQYVVLVTAMIPRLDQYYLEAAGAADRAVQLAPLYAETHLTRGMLAGARGNLPEAERNYREALRIDPENAAARNNLATIELRGNNLKAATAGFAAALAENPTLQVARDNIDIICRRVLRGARLAAQTVFIGAGFITIAYEGGPAFPATVAGLLAILWLVMVARLIGRLAKPVRAHLRSLIRNDRRYTPTVLSTMVFVGAALAAAWMPIYVVTVGILATIVYFVTDRLRRARTP
ncbi:tetratricopeptide repeat protein [Kutzneria kofuensis]|uniref:Tetratricopeptide (TPR) repeat protein n=1 Tax=Kutzneria kofuensis TaxID=103725 RepID=A0A7W9NJT6_9PSEU|nr:tetratricopeptide repeat protein [Kutzneria kofuensis]MBB5895280.1 tetratricopeptide (TPR) repeat protein [Kutzneria kofuensis]